MTVIASRRAGENLSEQLGAVLAAHAEQDWDAALIVLWRGAPDHVEQAIAGLGEHAARSGAELVVVALDQEPPPSLLTRRESQVLDMVATGLTNKEIARGLGVTVHTINRHVSSILRRLEVRNRAEAVHLHHVRSIPRQLPPPVRA